MHIPHLAPPGIFSLVVAGHFHYDPLPFAVGWDNSPQEK
jgi:hypothetical protein